MVVRHRCVDVAFWIDVASSIMVVLWLLSFLPSSAGVVDVVVFVAVP
jgi:hypothetical protein